MPTPAFGNDVTVTFRDVDPRAVRKILQQIQGTGYEHEVHVQSTIRESRLEFALKELDIPEPSEDKICEYCGLNWDNHLTTCTRPFPRVYGQPANNVFEHDHWCIFVQGQGHRRTIGRGHGGECELATDRVAELLTPVTESREEPIREARYMGPIEPDGDLMTEVPNKPHQVYPSWPYRNAGGLTYDHHEKCWAVQDQDCNTAGRLHEGPCRG